MLFAFIMLILKFKRKKKKQQVLYESDQLSTSQSPLRYDPKYFNRADTRPIGGGFGSQRSDGYGCTYFMDEHNSGWFIVSS